VRRGRSRSQPRALVQLACKRVCCLRPWRFPDLAAAPSHAFECSGVTAATESALRVLRPRGVLTVTGVAAKPPFYQAADLVFKELTIRGCFIYEQEFDMAIDLLDRGVVNIDPLDSDVRGIDSGPEAFAELRHAANLVNVLLAGSLADAEAMVGAPRSRIA
jgi:threonine dehydrogenase-like Zn-dependent dehydrogenase